MKWFYRGGALMAAAFCTLVLASGCGDDNETTVTGQKTGTAVAAPKDGPPPPNNQADLADQYKRNAGTLGAGKYPGTRPVPKSK